MSLERDNPAAHSTANLSFCSFEQLDIMVAALLGDMNPFVTTFLVKLLGIACRLVGFGPDNLRSCKPNHRRANIMTTTVGGNQKMEKSFGLIYHQPTDNFITMDSKKNMVFSEVVMVTTARDKVIINATNNTLGFGTIS